MVVADNSSFCNVGLSTILLRLEEEMRIIKGSVNSLVFSRSPSVALYVVLPLIPNGDLIKLDLRLLFFFCMLLYFLLEMDSSASENRTTLNTSDSRQIPEATNLVGIIDQASEIIATSRMRHVCYLHLQLRTF